MKITVLGAGIIGVTTAYYLHKQGHEVTVVDRANAIASECSFANGGQLSYSHAEPWATPGVLTKLPKWLIDADSPLVFHLSRDPYMWKWAFSFLKHCNNAQKEASTRHTLRLALHSRQCFNEIVNDTGIEFSYLKKGTVHIFRDQKSLDANIAQAEFQKKLGCDYQVLHTRADCERIEPSLKYSPTPIIGGLFFPMDETGDVNAFSVNLAKYLETKGVKFVFGKNAINILSEDSHVTAIMTESGRIEADAFVISSGAASSILLRKAGINVPIYPMKGYSLSIDIENPEKAPTSSITDQYNKIVYSRLGNILRVAGTAEFAGYDQSINPNRIATNYISNYTRTT